MTGTTAARLREPRRLLALLAAGWLVLPPLAQADGAALNAQTLGFTESVLNYCGPIEPALALKLREKVRQLVERATEQQIAEARNSDEYRKAYDSVSEFVAKVDGHDAKRICSESPP
jgi:hypothetical protein